MGGVIKNELLNTWIFYQKFKDVNMSEFIEDTAEQMIIKDENEIEW